MKSPTNPTPSLLAKQRVTLFSHTSAHHHQWFVQTVTSRQSDKTQHNPHQAMNTHPQQSMGTAVLVHVLLSNGGALGVITRTDEALSANAELRLEAPEARPPLWAGRPPQLQLRRPCEPGACDVSGDQVRRRSRCEHDLFRHPPRRRHLSRASDAADDHGRGHHQAHRGCASSTTSTPLAG